MLKVAHWNLGFGNVVKGIFNSIMNDLVNETLMPIELHVLNVRYFVLKTYFKWVIPLTLLHFLKELAQLTLFACFTIIDLEYTFPGQTFDIHASPLSLPYLCFGFVVLVVQKNLEVGEVLSVDVSSIVAMSATIDVQVRYNGPMRRVVFGVTFSCFFVFSYFIVLHACLLELFIFRKKEEKTLVIWNDSSNI